MNPSSTPSRAIISSSGDTYAFFMEPWDVVLGFHLPDASTKVTTKCL